MVRGHAGWRKRHEDHAATDLCVADDLKNKGTFGRLTQVVFCALPFLSMNIPEHGVPPMLNHKNHNRRGPRMAVELRFAQRPAARAFRTATYGCLWRDAS